nr:MAG TPA: hypothetical protein [Caudoviricetes sp.]
MIVVCSHNLFGSRRGISLLTIHWYNNGLSRYYLTQSFQSIFAESCGLI